MHIAHDALCDVPESSGASFEHGGNVAVETARRLGCDGALVDVVEGAKGEPLAVGRRTRAVPPADWPSTAFACRPGIADGHHGD